MKFFLSVLFVLVGLTSCNQESEWIYLFDGETTNGWRGYNAEVMPPGWTATECTLTFNTENRLESEYIGGRDIIYENEEFENFEFYVEWKLGEGGNSGILYHVKEGRNAPYEATPEYQLIDDLK